LNDELLTSVAGITNNKIQGTGKLPKEITMRVMALVLASMLAIFLAHGQAFAARGSSGASNPDRNYYQSAAGSCGGSAACYKNGSKKHPKKH
jgi:hypothetical protein